MNKKNNAMKPKNDLLELVGIDSNLGDEANLQLASPDLVNYYKAKQDRIIWLTFDIDDSLFQYIQLIYEWNRDDEKNNIPVEERKPIKILISSVGGDLLATEALIDMIKLSKTKVITVNISYAYSAGAIIFLAGHERYCFSNSNALLHNGSTQIAADFNSLQEANKNYREMIKGIQDYIVERTTIPKATLTKKLKQGDWYLSAEEQVKYGLASSIVTDIAQII